MNAIEPKIAIIAPGMSEIGRLFSKPTLHCIGVVVCKNEPKPAPRSAILPYLIENTTCQAVTSCK